LNILSNKVVIVTGASRGIGHALVRRMAEAGALVVCCARSESAVSNLASQLNAEGHTVLGLVADVTNPEAVRAMVQTAVDRHGRVNVLVNNVGVAGPTEAVELTSFEDWNQTIAANLTSAFLCLKEVIPHMKRQGGGSVVSIGSMTGKKPLAFRVGYAAAKMGLIGLTRTAAEELGAYKIRVNCVCPGSVTGERLNEVLEALAKKNGMSMDEIRTFAANMSPLKELPSADDVAEMVMFLASDAARHMTGQDINVSAGQIMY
jgi:NAD(P)-dependent dehydrogenase (short-subunit alcohol dehydrogenase family)